MLTVITAPGTSETPTIPSAECASCGSVRFIERTVLAHKLDDVAAGRRVETFPADVTMVLSCSLCGCRVGLVAC